MCNCNQISPCSQCLSGRSCGCPPSYDINVLPINCSGTTRCEESISTDCVIYTTKIDTTVGTCAGIATNDNLTTIISKLCPSSYANVLAILQTIGNNPDLRFDFCKLVGSCSFIPGTGTPILSPLIVTIP